MPVTKVKSKWVNGALKFTDSSDAEIATLNPAVKKLHLASPALEVRSVSDIDAQSGTLTAARLATGIIVHTSVTGAGTLTFDTAATIIALLGMAVGDTYVCYLINDGAFTDTLAADGGATVTLADAGQTIAADEACILLLLCTSATALTVFTIGA